MEWINAENDIWLLLILPAVLLLGYQAFWRRKWIGRLAEERFLHRLLRPLPQYKQFLTTFFFLISLGFLAAGLLNPAEPSKVPGEDMGGYEVSLVLDVSNSMLAKDVVPNRLELAKLLAGRLADTLEGSRMSAVVFAGESWLQLPPTTDIAAARSLIRVISPRSAPVQGTDVERALNMALETSEKTSTSNRAIVLLTDGEELEGDLETAAEEARKRGIMIITVMVGTQQGAPVADMDGATLLDADGRPVVSRANPEKLQQLAKDNNGRFIEYTTPDATLAAVLNTLKQLQQQPLVNSYMVNMKSYSPWFFVLAALAILASLFIPVIPANRKGKNDFSAGNRLLPKATTFLVPFISLWFLGNTQNTATPRKADELLKKGRLEEAQLEYEKVLQKEPANANAQLHLGNAFFRQGDFESAANWYGKSAASGISREGRLAAWNNLGLAMAKMGKPGEAINAFTQALRQSPGDEEVITNLQKAIAEKQKHGKPPPPKDSPKKNKLQDDAMQQLRNEEEQTRRNRERMQRPVSNPKGKNW